MPGLALIAVLLAAVTHSTWNLYAKKAAGSRHFVWLYSVGSIVLYLPIIAWIMVYERPHLGTIEYLALSATAVLHTGYSLVLQAGYRTSDLSLVYPIARGSGPLLSFVGATILLGERPTVLAGLGLVLIVAGILLVAGLTREPHRAPKAGIFFGLLTGLFIAGYTVNDGWSVKSLALSPFIIDFSGNLIRVVVLTPLALRDLPGVAREARVYVKPAAVVGVLGPLGYILVLFAMRIAPISHVAPARELSTLVGTYFGSRLLQEKAVPARLAGAVCIVVGVVSLAFAQ
ncbi:MAG TPA: DMT family transporter [Steroidobacteraceae bacterium]|jgi:drug/metabolite transporter (DMT)-like permease|nr:DMT family transporter [Steroidobacteraceae bacterium]